jgi:hypothetical protein
MAGRVKKGIITSKNGKPQRGGRTIARLFFLIFFASFPHYRNF